MKTIGIMIAVVTLVGVLALPSLAASPRECVSVRIDAPFRLPDGTVHPAGQLTLCDTREFSPVTELHAILVNGASVGIFPSRRHANEIGRIEAPRVLFERESEGTLALIGYVVSSAGRSLSFRLRPADVRRSEPSPIASGPVAGTPIAAIIAAGAP
jgi:hypothetical protein